MWLQSVLLCGNGVQNVPKQLQPTGIFNTHNSHILALLPSIPHLSIYLTTSLHYLAEKFTELFIFPKLKFTKDIESVAIFSDGIAHNGIPKHPTKSINDYRSKSSNQIWTRMLQVVVQQKRTNTNPHHGEKYQEAKVNCHCDSRSAYRHARVA